MKPNKSERYFLKSSAILNPISLWAFGIWDLIFVTFKQNQTHFYMKRSLFILATAAFLSSCGGYSDEQKQVAEKVKKINPKIVKIAMKLVLPGKVP